MKTIDQWFSEYAQSHQNPTNQMLHKICVPVIYFSIIGWLVSIPAGPLQVLAPHAPSWATLWAWPALLAVLIFYARLSTRVAVAMLLVSLVFVWGNWLLGQRLPLAWVSTGLFVLAWVGQFIGHHIEGAKPSFFKDLQFLLIGPPWVVEALWAGSLQPRR